MKIKTAAIKMTALAAALVMAVSAVPGGAVVTAEAASLTDLNSEYAQLEQQQADLQSKVDEAKTAAAKQKAIKNQLTYEVNILSSQISILEQKIEYYETEINRNEAKIGTLNETIDENNRLLRKRLRAMYMTDTSTTLGLIFGGESFSEFLSGGVYIQSIAAHDQSLIDDLLEDKSKVEEARLTIASDRAEIESAKVELEGKKSELNTKVADANSQLQDIAAMEAAYAADLKAIQADMAAVQSEIDAIYAAMADSGEYVGGSFAYPIPGFYVISSYFGWRFNGTDYHTGVDFPAAGGTAIRATNAGTVTFVKTTYIAGRGYGKYLIIDHGGGYSSLYAHCSSIAVSVGDFVSKGETIAYVGTTGWSTGNHLHFEIRVNGVAQNPLNYLTK